MWYFFKKSCFILYNPKIVLYPFTGHFNFRAYTGMYFWITIKEGANTLPCLPFTKYGNEAYCRYINLIRDLLIRTTFYYYIVNERRVYTILASHFLNWIGAIRLLKNTIRFIAKKCQTLLLKVML